MTVCRPAQPPGVTAPRTVCGRCDGERGAAVTATLLGVAVVLTVVAVALVAVVDLAATAARARSAADAAALAAAGTSPLVARTTSVAAGPRTAAAGTAVANGGRLARIDLDGWPLRVRVEVAVAPRTRWVRTARPRLVAGATAGVRPAAGAVSRP